MKKIIISLIAIVVIASSCTKEVKTPAKKNPELVMRKRSAAPPKPY